MGQAPNLYWGELLAVGAMGVDLWVGRGAAQTPDSGWGETPEVEWGWGRVTGETRKWGTALGRLAGDCWKWVTQTSSRGLHGGTGVRQSSGAQARLLEVEAAVCQVPGTGSFMGVRLLDTRDPGKPRDPARRS